MTQSWVSQIVSSLDSIIKILTQFGLESYALKVCISLKIYVNITIFLVWVFGQNCDDIFRPKCFNTVDHNVLILLLSNINNGNIGTFQHRNLCMKSWYNSKSLWILSISLVCSFYAKTALIPPIYILLEFLTIRL